MAVMKKSVRKKLSKYLARLVKKHGAEMTLALVTGIVSSLAADQQAKADRKAGKPAKSDKRGKAGCLVAVVVFLTWPLGLILWLVFRPDSRSKWSRLN